MSTPVGNGDVSPWAAIYLVEKMVSWLSVDGGEGGVLDWDRGRLSNLFEVRVGLRACDCLVAAGGHDDPSSSVSLDQLRLRDKGEARVVRLERALLSEYVLDLEVEQSWLDCFLFKCWPAAEDGVS